jgi:hypothetical protein
VRVFHFVNGQYGLENIRLRRLKVATLQDLNDPFELFAVSFADSSLRTAFRHLKERLDKRSGLLCFSRKWSNPVQWSHYADRHRGLCLGFEVPNALLRPVSYSAKRLVAEAEKLLRSGPYDHELMMRFLSTKYVHWKYENESRVFVSFEEDDVSDGLYFYRFSVDLKLEQVIVGAESTITRQDVADALGELALSVQTSKARLAFKSFRVVRQRDQRQWL